MTAPAPLTPEEQLDKSEQWLKLYPWQSEEQQKCFLAFVQHMRGPAKKCAGPQTDLQCLAAYLFGKDLEAIEWWRELVASIESDLRAEIARLMSTVTALNSRINTLERKVNKAPKSSTRSAK